MSTSLAPPLLIYQQTKAEKNEDNPSLSYFYEMLMMSEEGWMERAMFHRKAGGLVVAPVYAREGIC